jgi:hypothetical protein
MSTTRTLAPSSSRIRKSLRWNTRATVSVVALMVAVALVGCGAACDGPTTFRGSVRGSDTDSATIEFVVSADRDSIDSLRIDYEIWSVELPPGHSPATVREDGTYERYTFDDAPLLIENGAFSHSEPRTPDRVPNGLLVRIEGRFTSATEATGTVELIQVKKGNTAYEAGEFTWTASAQ